MVKLVKKLETNILTHVKDSVKIFGVNISVGYGSYFKIGGFEALTQQYSKNYTTEGFDVENNTKHGLIINKDKDFELLEISY